MTAGMDATGGAQQRAGKSARVRNGVLLLALLVLAIAYRALARFDGGAVPGGLEGTDALFFSPLGSSPRLIFAVTLWLLARRWPTLRAALAGRPAPLLATALLAPAAGLAAWAHYVDASDLLVPSLCLLLLGAAALLGGRGAARAIAFPALFLLLALPIPRMIVNLITYPMQLATAQATAWILDLFGLHALALGDLIWTEGHLFQVIESCAGLRSTQTLVMASLVYIEVFRRSRLESVMLVLASPLLGLLVNELRVLSIVLNPYATDETVHAIQGIVMIVVGVLLIAALDSLLQHLMPGARPRPWPPRGTAAAPRLAGGLALAGLGFALAGFSLAVTPWQAPAADPALDIASFPSEWAGWALSERGRPDFQFLGSVGFDRCLLREYTRGGDEVELMICSDRRASGGNRMLSRKLWVPGPGWVVEKLEHADRGPGTRDAAYLMAGKGEERLLLLHWRSGTSSWLVEILRGMLALDRGPLRRTDRALGVRIATQLDGEEDALTSARARVERFARDLREPLSSWGAIGAAE